MTPKIRSIVEKFVEDLQAALAEEGSAAIHAALTGGTPAAAKRGPGRAPKSKAPTVKAGSRRSAEDIDALAKLIVTALKKNKDGLRSEQIAAELGVTTKDLPLAIKKLLESKAIRSKGVRRGTTYFAK